MAVAELRGRFITLEGVDGAGKSTHIPWIAEKLRAAPLADAVDFQQLAPVMAKVKARYSNSRPVAELEAMIGKLK